MKSSLILRENQTKVTSTSFLCWHTTYHSTQENSRPSNILWSVMTRELNYCAVLEWKFEWFEILGIVESIMIIESRKWHEKQNIAMYLAWFEVHFQLSPMHEKWLVAKRKYHALEPSFLAEWQRFQLRQVMECIIAHIRCNLDEPDKAEFCDGMRNFRYWYGHTNNECG